MKKQISNKKYFGIGNVPLGIGAVLNGWHGGASSVLDFRAMTSACPHNCFDCFTNKSKKTLTLEKISGVINQAADLGYRGIDFLGEGEPTLDKDFFKIINYTSSKGIVPIVFTEGAKKLRDKNFVKRIYNSGASVCLKCDSLFNANYQNWVVGDKKSRYFDKRNEALSELLKQGFNEKRNDGTTRLGFDMVITKRNFEEIEKTLRYCRDNNYFIVFARYLPAGRSGREDFDKSSVLSEKDLTNIRDIVKKVDVEYNFNHPIYNNFMTFPCVEFIQVYGDGRVSPCPGNENIVGNIKTDSLKDLRSKVLKEFPCHNSSTFDGFCLYRTK